MSSSSASAHESYDVIQGKTKVPPAKIVGELERIRREAAALDSEKEALASGEAAPRVRSTLSNLVLLVFEDEPSIGKSTVENLITELCVAFPSRFFVAGFSQNRGDESDSVLDTAVSSRCVLTNSGMHVCSEEVYVSVHPGSVDLVPNLLLSLLIPDVETILLVLGDPGSVPSDSDAAQAFKKLLTGLDSVSDRVEYDSAFFRDYALSHRQLFDDDAQGSTARRDLNWSRMAKWRSLLAEQFDSEGGEGIADGVSKFRLSTSVAPEQFLLGRPGSDVLLFLGWCFSCLDWTVESAKLHKKSSELELTVSDGSAEYSVVIVNDDHAEFSFGSALDTVELGWSCAGKERTLRMHRDRASASLEINNETSAVSSSGGARSEVCRRAPFPEQSLEKIILSDLGPLDGTAEYLKASEMAINLRQLIADATG
jgi:glucose-6-phosphate dehydrogenase assembly protein OpcA